MFGLPSTNNIPGSALQGMMNDPVMNSLFSGTVGGSPFLTRLAMTDPTAISSAFSPGAAAQAGSLYGPSSTAGLNWIPNFNPTGPGFNAQPTSMAALGQTAGTSQVG